MRKITYSRTVSERLHAENSKPLHIGLDWTEQIMIVKVSDRMYVASGWFGTYASLDLTLLLSKLQTWDRIVSERIWSGRERVNAVLDSIEFPDRVYRKKN